MFLISRHWRGCSIAAIVVLTAWTYWPGLGSFFVSDDFFLVAIARLLDNPFAPFVQNHFPGGAFYRPLTFLFWWSSVALFGNTPLPQYFVNLALHVAISIAFWRLLYAWTRTRAAPLLATLMFALHPIAIGTALWLSDRFDLLAVLFGILAIDAAWRYRATLRGSALIATLLCAMLAVLAKEIGFAAYAAIAVIWLWPSAPPPRWWTPQRRAIIALALLAVVLLAWRAVVLGGVLQSRVVADTSIAGILIEAAQRWVPNLLAYFLDLSRLPFVGRIIAAAGVIVLIGLALVGVVRVRTVAWRDERILFVVSALALMLATVVLQAPVLRLMQFSPDTESAALWVVQSRMFYYSLLGLIAAVYGVILLAPSNSAKPGWLSYAATIVAVLCIFSWAIDAHRLARQYRRESYAQMQLVQSAQAQIDKLPLPNERCMVFVLGVPSDQEFRFSNDLDAAIKALATDLTRVQNCRFATDRTPWFFVLKRNALRPESATPMQPVYLDGRMLSWLEYGGVQIDYLNLFDNIDAKSMTSAFFLDYQQGRFVDVTADVLAERREVKFRCVRRPEQCISPAVSKP